MPVSTAGPGCTVARPRSLGHAAGGFTLIELMIAVAIVAILAAVALPSYQDSVRRGNRGDATSLLQAVNLAQEKHRLGNTAYAATFAALTPPCNCSSTSERGHYTLAISGASATGYTLTANAASSMQQADTGCTAITLTVAGGNTTYGPNTCWSK